MLIQSWEWRVPGTPETLWPIAGDTERFNRLAQNPPVTYQEVPDPRGGSQRYGSFCFKGIPTSWHELPYEWREPEGWSIRRIYSTGPVAEFLLRLRLIPDGTSTRMAFSLELTPRNALLAPFMTLVARELKTKSGLFADRVTGWANGQYDRVFTEPVARLASVAQNRLDLLSGELITMGFTQSLVERLVSMIAEAPDFELLKIRPYAVADRWGVDRMTVLRLFLHATRLGLLEMSWDLVCPDCRGAKERHSSLAQLKSSVHCGSCNIDFAVNFDASVELTFRPSPAIRKVESLLFCVGGPGNTPHVVAQRLLAASEADTLGVPAEAGSYRLRSPQVPGTMALTVSPEGDTERHLVLMDSEPLPVELTLAPGARLHLRNADPAPTLVILERTRWADDVVRASSVTAMQEFRDLFAAQKLAPGVEMGISRLAFLFSDLKASTAMYALMGDGPAFALVQQHFRILEREVATHRGAIVKTIGDAIMAVFADAGDCVRAGLAIQEAIAAFNAQSDHPPVIVKLGAHLGPTIAVSLNERLDYFGTTVNVAARVQNESIGGDLVLTDEMLGDPGVQQALRGLPLEREGFEVRLKGLERPHALTRFWLQERQGTGQLLERMIQAHRVDARERR